VDCFDALASERPYRKALTVDEAMEFVRSKAGTQFDPEVVRLLGLHYLDLEEKAKHHIEEIEPLKTDTIVSRGDAPGAGLLMETPARDSVEDSGSLKEGGPVSPAAERVQPVWAREGISHPLSNSVVARQACLTMSARLRAVIPFDCFALYLVSGQFIVPLYFDGPSAQAFSSKPIPNGEGLSGWVVMNERSILNGNPTVEPNYLAQTGLMNATSSALSIPLKDMDGAVFGALTIYSATQGAFSNSDLRVMQHLQLEFSLLLQEVLRFEAQGAGVPEDDLQDISDMKRLIQQADETHLPLGSSAGS
jgi:putative methionine-R-sulfoxide reductase with GAF domain